MRQVRQQLFEAAEGSHNAAERWAAGRGEWTTKTNAMSQDTGCQMSLKWENQMTLPNKLTVYFDFFYLI